MAYELRYCAYADILGFTRMIAGLEKGDISHQLLRELLSEVHDPKPSSISVHQNSDLKVQSISDAVCISAACTHAGLDHLFFSLERLAIGLLRKGFFLRGAVVKGNLYHDDKMAFGQALVRAYQLESTVVRFPRIMIASDVKADAAHFQMDVAKKGHLLDIIRQADDGPSYLHILRPMYMALGAHDDEWKNCVPEYNEIAAQIQQRFDEAVDNPQHFEKVQWFARYWNYVVFYRGNRVRLIDGPNIKHQLNFGPSM